MSAFSALGVVVLSTVGTAAREGKGMDVALPRSMVVPLLEWLWENSLR
jgi:hypothetical protein